MSTLKKRKTAASDGKNNKMDVSVFVSLSLTLSTALSLPRRPQLRSDTWLSNSMNPGESSSVASVRDYQHTFTAGHTQV